MPPSYKMWPDVTANPQFQSLPAEQRSALRQSYFDDVVAPQVPPDQHGAAWAAFRGDTDPDMTPPPPPEEPSLASTIFNEIGQGIVGGIGEGLQGTAELLHEPAPRQVPVSAYEAAKTGASGFHTIPADGPIEQSPLYRAGQWVGGVAKEAYPTTQAQDESIPGMIARNVGAIAPLALTGPAALPAGAGYFGLTGAAGEAARAREKGATDQQAHEAAQSGADLGMAVGLADVGVILKPIQRAAPGFLPYVEAKLAAAARNGLVFHAIGEAQEWLADQFRQEYDPSAKYDFDPNRALAALGTGAILGLPTPSPYNPDLARQRAFEKTKAALRDGLGAQRPDRDPGPAPSSEEAPPPDPVNPEAAAAPLAEYVQGQPAAPSPGPALWKSKDYDYPVTVINEPPQVGPDGTRYQKVLHEGQETYVPVGELAGASAQPTPHANLAGELKEVLDNPDKPVADIIAARDGLVPVDDNKALADQLRRTWYNPQTEQFRAWNPETSRFEDAGTLNDRAAAEAPKLGTLERPVEVAHPDDTGIAGAKVDTQPTEGQKEAGNYRKGHLKWQGMEIAIENPAGSSRRGKDAQGKPWETQMPVDYGYIKRTEGADGDQVDMYFGKHPQSDKVFVIDQVDPETGKFDEHKVMIGFDGVASAYHDYQRSFSDGKGKQRVGNLTPLTIHEFKDWLKNGDTTKPLSRLPASNEGEKINTPAPARKPRRAEATMAELEKTLDRLPQADPRRAQIMRQMDNLADVAISQLPPPSLPPISPDLSNRAAIEAQMAATERLHDQLPPHDPRRARLKARMDAMAEKAIADIQSKNPPERPHPAIKRLSKEELQRRHNARLDEVAAKPVESDTVKTRKAGRRKAASSKPESLLEFIANRGGIEDTGGELRAMDLHRWHLGKKFQKKLLRPAAPAEQRGMFGKEGATGHAPDDWALRAWEHGYFPESADRPSIDALFEAMRAEDAGAKRHPPGDVVENPEFDTTRDEHEKYQFYRRRAEELGIPFEDRELDAIMADVVERETATAAEAEETRIADALERDVALEAIAEFPDDDIPFDIGALHVNAATQAGAKPETPRLPAPENAPARPPAPAEGESAQPRQSRGEHRPAAGEGAAPPELAPSLYPEDKIKNGWTARQREESPDDWDVYDAQGKHLQMLAADNAADAIAQADLPYATRKKYDKQRFKTERIAAGEQAVIPGAASASDFPRRLMSEVDAAIFQEWVAKPVRKDGRRLLDAVTNQDGAAINLIILKYQKYIGRFGGGGGAGPGKVKKAPSGVARLYELADASRRYLEKKVIGQQQVIPGAEKISDKQLAERKMAEPKRAAVEQKAPGSDGGLFDGGERNQTTMKFSRGTAPPAPTFYSALTRAVEGLKQPKARSEQWRGMIDNLPGVKKEEIEWSGLKEWLAAQHGPVTKEQMLDFLRANEVQVKEVKHGAPTPNENSKYAIPEVIEAVKGADASEGDLRRMLANDFKAYHALMEKFPELQRADEEGKNWAEVVLDDVYGTYTKKVKYDQYTLPGGKDYRELLLTLPDKKPQFVEMREGENGLEAVFSDGSTYGFKGWSREKAEVAAREQAEKGQIAPLIREKFHSHHFDEANVLAHIRFNERTDADGKRVLFIEEIQSDWHQEGRKKGYQSDVPAELRENIRKAQQAFTLAADAQGLEIQKRREAWEAFVKEVEPKTLDQIAKELGYGRWHSDLKAKKKAAVARAYAQQRLKKSIAMEDFNDLVRGATGQDGYMARLSAKDMAAALREGLGREIADKLIAGTKNVIGLRAKLETEERRASPYKGGVPDAPFKTTWPELAVKRMIRYAAEHGFDRLAWTPGITQIERYESEMRRAVDQIEWFPRPDGNLQINARKNGLEVFGGEADEHGVIQRARLPGAKGKTIEDVFGKEIARRMIEEKTGQAEGADLAIGGEGMKGFYDKILPNFVNKYVKKWGGKVGTTEFITKGLGSPSQEREFAQAHALDITPAMRASVTQEGQPLFARKQGQASPVLYTAPAVKDILTRRFGKTAKILFDNGIVHVVQSIRELPELPKGYVYHSDMEGVYMGNHGEEKVYLVADSFTSRAKIENVFIHEAGVHAGMRAIMGEEAFQRVARAVLRLAEEGRRAGKDKATPAQLAAMEAHERAKAAHTSEKDMAEETLAYFVDAAPDLPLARRVISALKRWVNKNFGVVALSPEDYRQAAIAALHGWARREGAIARPRGEPKLTSEPVPENARALFSRASLPRRIDHPDIQRKLASVRKWWRRYLTKEGLLNEPTFQRKIEMEGMRKADEMQFETMIYRFHKDVRDAYGKSFDHLTPDEKRALKDYLAGEDAAIPDAMKPRIAHMRDFLDTMSARMQDALTEALDIKIQEMSPKQREQAELFLKTDGADGSIPEHIASQLRLLQTIENNKGVYLHRSYQAFDDPKWKDKALRNRDLIARAEAFIAEQNPKLTPTEVTGAVRAILQTAREKGNFVSYLSGGAKVGGKDITLLKKRKDVPAVIRELLGEYQDPKVTFLRSAAKMSSYLSGHYFLTRLRKDGLGTFLFKKPTGHFDTLAAAEGSDAMSPINGLYATEDFAQALLDAKGTFETGAVMRQYLAFNSLVKYGKTVLSPTTQARNFMSASFFSLGMGHFDWQHMIKSFRATKADLWSHEEKWETYLQDLVRLGVLHSNPRSQELRDAIDDAIDANYFGRDSRVGRVLGASTKLYQSGDDFWKILGFENEKALLMKHQDLGEAAASKKAAQRIRDGYPTYSMIPRGVRWLRRAPLIGAFVSFNWEMLRTTRSKFLFMMEDAAAGAHRMVAYRATGLAISAAAAFAAKQASMMILGLNDDDDESVRSMAPPWQRNAQLLYLGYDKDGLPMHIDLSFIDPYSVLKKPISALLNGNNEGLASKLLDAIREAGQPFFGPDIAAGVLGELTFNQKINGGRVYNPEDTTIHQGLDIFHHLKTLLPGFASNVERTILAIRGDVSKSGKQYKLSDELLAWAGFRATTLNVPQSLLYKSYEFQDRKKDATQILSAAAGSQNTLSEGDIRDAFERMEKGRTAVYRDLIKSVRAARKLGMKDARITALLDASGLSQADAAFVTRGKTPLWTPSPQFLNSAEYRALFSAATEQRGREIQHEIAARKLLITKLAGEAAKKAIESSRPSKPKE